MSTIQSVLVCACVGYAAIVALMYVSQRSLMYMPPRTPPPSPSESGVPNFDVVTYETLDGLTLSGWHHPARAGQPTIVYFQGNAGHTADRAFKAPHWVAGGFGVMFAGYRGYSGNPGSPSETGLARDADAALGFLAANGVAVDQIVLYGESLGTGVASDVAYRLAKSETPVRGVILEAPFTSMADAAQSHYPWLPARYLVKDRYDTLDKIGDIRTPLLVMHGDKDRVVPFQQGKSVYETASQPKKAQWFAGGRHSDLYDFGAADTVLGFLQGLE